MTGADDSQSSAKLIKSLEDKPEWVREAYERIEKEKRKILKDSAQTVDSDKQISLTGKKFDFLNHRRKTVKKKSKIEIGFDDSKESSLVIDDYISDNGEDSTKSDSNYSEKRPNITPKLFYTSRTHSQLSQFTSELRKTSYSSTPTITLASRRQLCINPDVNKLSSLNAINERCLDLQKEKSSKGCPYLDRDNMDDFAEYLVTPVRDIEDIVEVGKQVEICPYYASRKAINSARLVLLPYNLMLSKESREAFEIDISNS
ncbi:ATP-dependent DNA helicase chl1, partial [Nowakowskiella sp. JEL0078]